MFIKNQRKRALTQIQTVGIIAVIVIASLATYYVWTSIKPKPEPEPEPEPELASM